MVLYRIYVLYNTRVTLTIPHVFYSMDVSVWYMLFLYDIAFPGNQCCPNYLCCLVRFSFNNMLYIFPTFQI